jgi:hypothetical protein
MKLRTRRQRVLTDTLKRAAVALFVIVFIASVVGVAIVTIVR